MDLDFRSFDELTQRNPGALRFVMEAGHLYGDLGKYASVALMRMLYAGITGPALYMVWNDCCYGNTPEAITIMLERDIADIKDHISGVRGIPF